MTHESIETIPSVQENIKEALKSGNAQFAIIVLKGLIVGLTDHIPLQKISALKGVGEKGAGGLEDFLKDSHKQFFIVPLFDNGTEHISIFRGDDGEIEFKLVAEGNMELLAQWHELGF